LDGPINRASFDAWVETQLIPVLKSGDIVVLDNLSSHKSAKAKKAIKAVGAHLFFLPPYSSDPRLCGDKPQSHRASLCKTQNADSKGRSQNCGRTLESRRAAA